MLFELGVRHAVRKHATLIIAEKELTFPFDLSHIAIDSYEHLGRAIDYEEVLRFREVIKAKVQALLDEPRTDSPLYSLLPNLNTPSFTAAEVREIKDEIQNEVSLSDILLEAEVAKNAKRYEDAKQLLKTAAKMYPSTEFVIQRLVLMIYKSQLPDKITALNDALAELKALDPERTTDPETLGLAGAIYKRFFEANGKREDLEFSIWYYSRGFYVKQDYYNGINLAYLYNVKATLTEEQIEAYSNYGQSIEIRKKVITICENLLSDKSFKARDDQEWIFLTLAEAMIGLGVPERESHYLELLKTHTSGEFAMDSYLEQREKLIVLIAQFKERWDLV